VVDDPLGEIVVERHVVEAWCQTVEAGAWRGRVRIGF
jgi:hypothetical protein